MKGTKNKHTWLAISGIIFLLIGSIMLLNIPSSLNNFMVKHNTQKTFTREYNALGKPLTLLGFENIESTTVCSEASNYSCVVTNKAYMPFDTQTKKDTAVDVADKLSSQLQSQGWTQREDQELQVKQWFKDVLSGKDWYPDAYAYKQVANTYCTLDFFVAYANPSTPAIQAVYECSNPATVPFGKFPLKMRQK